MFGLNDENQNSNDDPAMLDNVKDLASQPASQVEPPQMAASPAAAAPPDSTTSFSMPQTAPAASVPEPTTDNSSNSGTSVVANPAHAEVAEGFSNAADFVPTNPTDDSTTNSSNESTLPDNTIPSPSTADSSITTSLQQTPEVPVIPAEPPKIQSTSIPAVPAEEPEQNDVIAPPAPTTMEVPASESPVSAAASVDTSTTDTAQTDVDHDALASLKQEALGHLEALSDHIEGNPEEVFRTTMQMIQANDNHTLLQKALEAAKKIEDDKVRAQAMQDIINEINYFSPPQN